MALQFKRGTAEAMARVNPLLLAGQPGLELDTGQVKVGNGVNNWNDLPYVGNGLGGSGSGIVYCEPSTDTDSYKSGLSGLENDQIILACFKNTSESFSKLDSKSILNANGDSVEIGTESEGQSFLLRYSSTNSGCFYIVTQSYGTTPGVVEAQKFILSNKAIMQFDESTESIKISFN